MAFDKLKAALHPQQQTPALPLIAPIQGGIAPCPTEIAFAELGGPNGQKFVLMQFSTPSGVQFYFVDPAAAKRLGEQLVAISSGIVIAPSNAIG